LLQQKSTLNLGTADAKALAVKERAAFA